MKNWIILIGIILLNQFLIPYFEMQIAFLILASLILALVRDVKKVFIKTFVIQMFVSTLIYFQYSNGVSVLKNIILSADLPIFILPLSFILINALTTSFSFQIGYSIKMLLKNKE